jgi:hypothetical protein
VPLGFMNPQNKRGAPGPASELFPDACASGNSSSSGPLGAILEYRRARTRRVRPSLMTDTDWETRQASSPPDSILPSALWTRKTVRLVPGNCAG